MGPDELIEGREGIRREWWVSVNNNVAIRAKSRTPLSDVDGSCLLGRMRSIGRGKRRPC